MTEPALPPALQDVDPIDSRLARAQQTEIPHTHARPQGPLATPPASRALVLVPAGFALGPAGLNLLSPETLSFVEPLVSVALATLGVLLGFELVTMRVSPVASVVRTLADTALTIALVAAGVVALGTAWDAVAPSRTWLALMLAVCAAASFSAAMAPGRADRTAPCVGEISTLVAILAAAALLIVPRYASAVSLATATLGATAIAIALAAAGWLLVGRTSSDREQHAFVAGTLLLLGGGAAYLQQSALFFGLLAGAVWARADLTARDRLFRDIRYVQHPLVVLLLLVAGAYLAPTVEAAALGLLFLLCRTPAKLLGAWLLSTPDRSTIRTLPQLLSPGIAGLAIALGAEGAAADLVRPGLLLTAVAIGTIVTDLIVWGSGLREDPA